MKRTSSGSDLARSSNNLLAATPYVYMAAHNDDDDASLSSPTGKQVFRRLCAGITVNAPGGVNFSLPSSNVEVQNGCVMASSLPTPLPEPLFALPLPSIVRCSIQKTGGTRGMHIWQLLCGCCFGERDVVLELECDLPTGSIQWAPACGVSGYTRINFFVNDVDTWIDAIGIRMLLSS
jgi:hypothetical protein